MNFTNFFDWIPFLKRKFTQENNSNEGIKRARFDIDITPQSETHEATFLESVKKILSCTVCFDVGTHARQCKNGHLICGLCITRLQQSNSDFNCPVCRCSLKKGLIRSLTAEQLILELPAFCKFCQETMSIKNLKQHETSICSLRDISCEYNLFGCGWTGKAGTADSHQSSCQYKEKTVIEIQENVSQYTREIRESSQKTMNQWVNLIDKIKDSSEGYKFVVKQIMLDRRQSKSLPTDTLSFKSSTVYNSNSCCRRHGWVVECFLSTNPFKVEYKIVNQSKKKHKVSFFISSVNYDDKVVMVTDQLHIVQFSRGIRESGKFEIDVLDAESHTDSLKLTDALSVDLCLLNEVDPDETAEATAEEPEEDDEEIDVTENGASNFLLALLSPNLQAVALNGGEEEEEEAEEEEDAASNASETSAADVAESETENNEPAVNEEEDEEEAYF